MAQPRLTTYDRLDGTEVRAVLTYLGERIDAYLPRHPGLRAAVEECSALVDGLLDRRRHAPGRRAAMVWTSRALIVVMLVVVLVATTFAARDAIANASSFESFEWLPLVESLINDLVFAGIAIWFLLSIADRVVRGDLIRRHALVLDTVSEIENLTTGMSRKIWQKISLLQATDRTHRPPS